MQNQCVPGLMMVGAKVGKLADIPSWQGLQKEPSHRITGEGDLTLPGYCGKVHDHISNEKPNHSKDAAAGTHHCNAGTFKGCTEEAACDGQNPVSARIMPFQMVES